MTPDQNWLQGWIQWTLPLVARIGSDASDEDNIRLQKSLLVICALPFMVAGWAWRLMYFFFQEPLAGAMPFSCFEQWMFDPGCQARLRCEARNQR
jgi:hypothetical protein